MNRTVVALAVVTVLVAGGAGATPETHVLVVADAGTGESLMVTPVSNGTAVGLEYTHSVEKNRVYETYAVRGDRLDQTRIEFQSYGWGYPAQANVTIENGSFVYDPDRTLSELTVAPGQIPRQKLHVGPDTYDLMNLSDGRSVRIHVVSCSPSKAVSAAKTDTYVP